MDAALVSDPVESRRKLAVGLGAAAAVDPLTEDLKQRAVDHFGSLPEVVIEVAGRAGLLAVATDLVAAHGRILLAGLHGEPESFHRLTPLVKEVSILFPNFTTKPGFVHTMARLEDGSLAPEALITHHVTLAELPGIVAALRVPNDFGKVLIAMD
jgi:threonine dehydrogenase-like Zn-dependent dehydrogenase